MSAVAISQAADVYQERFDGLIVRTRDIANSRSTGPDVRRKLLEVVDELARLRRDLSALGTDRPLAAVPTGRAPNNGGQRTGTQKVRGAFFRPPDGMRYCANHDGGDGAMLPIDQFSVKNAATGQRRSWCDACYKAYQRERYVSVKAKTVTVKLIEGDKCVGHDCPICGFPFEIGERITGSELRHEGCAK